MGLLTRDEILGRPDTQEEQIDVPEWGGEVRVRGLTGKERDAFEASLVSTNGRPDDMNMENIRAKLVILSVVSSDGSHVFRWPADVELVGDRCAAALDRIFAVAQRLSGIRRRELEEMVKNSEPGPADDSSSD
jgi:hypothetical protein